MSEKKFLDEVGLGHTWSKIKSLLTGKADTDLNNVTNDNFRDKAIDAGVGGLQVVTATSTDGVTYTATVTGVTALTAGLTIVIIPNVVSASISAKLNVNGLGDKYIRQSTTNNSTTGLTPKNANWMAANKPVTIQYDGTQWKTIAARSNASDLNGTLAIANGGTGGEKFVKDASISGKVITLTYSDDTTETLTTQDTTGVTPSRYVTSKYTSGTEWYEVYNDGWVRQGGIIAAGATKTFSKPFKDTNYTLCASIRGSSSSTNNINWTLGTPRNKTATSFQAHGSGAGFEWIAEGKGA